MPKSRKIKRKRSIKIVFVAIALPLVTIMILYAYQTLTSPCLQDLPADLRLEEEPWMRYAPSTAQYVLFINTTETLALKEGRDLMENKTVLDLAVPDFTLRSEDVVYLAGVSLVTNQFVNIIKPKAEPLAVLTASLEDAAGLSSTRYLDHTLYPVRILGENRGSTAGILTLDREHVILVQGETAARKAIQDVLDASSAPRETLFSEAQQAVTYALMKQRAREITGFSYTRPSAPVAGETGIGKLVYVSGGALFSETYYQYVNQTDARHHLEAARESLFTRAKSVCIVGGLIQVVEAVSLAEINRILPGL